MPLSLAQLEAAVTRLGTEVGETGDKIRADAAKIEELKAELAGNPDAQAKIDAIATSLEASADQLDGFQATLEAPNPGVNPNA